MCSVFHTRVFFDFVFSREVPADSYEDLLSKGYFRLADIIFCSRYIVYDRTISSLLHIRVPLDEFKAKKSYRRILNKVESRFTVNICRAETIDQMQHLYELFKERLSGFILQSISSLALDDDDHEGFETWSVQVYDGDKMIACSFFDRCDTAVAGVFAMHHPDYNEFGLGNYTLLKEILFSQEEGHEFYYPGYVLDNSERFHYKTRFKPLQQMNQQGQWSEFQPPVKVSDGTIQQIEIFESIEKSLNENKIPFRKKLNPFFTMGYELPEMGKFITGLVIFEIDQGLVIEYDSRKSTYRLAEVKPFEDYHRLFKAEIINTDYYRRDECYLQHPLVYEGKSRNSKTLNGILTELALRQKNTDSVTDLS